MGADRLASRRAGATSPPPRDFGKDRLELGNVHLGADSTAKGAPPRDPVHGQRQQPGNQGGIADGAVQIDPGMNLQDSHGRKRAGVGSGDIAGVAVWQVFSSKEKRR
jgi:hypothetical protein